MPQMANDKRRRVESTAGGRPVSPSRVSQARSSLLRCARAALTIGPRLALLLAIVWSFTGPLDQLPLTADTLPVGAAGLPPGAAQAGSTARGAIHFPETGYVVGTGPLGSYFVARGGVRTFGPPVTNEFTLLGTPAQIFRNHLLRQDPSGAVSTVNLFELGAIPSRDIGTSVFPEVDPALQGSAPVPGSPDYAAAVQAFIQQHAPDQWEGQPVGFRQAFLATVTFEDAFPSGSGDRNLLPGMAHEVWGVPVSRPTRDPRNSDIVYLRWERGVMAWSARTGAVMTVPLGDVFKSVLTGQGLSPELAAQAAGSRFFSQVNPATPGALARAADLPDTTVGDAFVANAGSISAAAANMEQGQEPFGMPAGGAPYQQATATPYGYNPNTVWMTPTPTPYGYNPAAPYPGQAYGTPTATPYGYIPPPGIQQPGVPQPGVGVPVPGAAGIPPGAQPGLPGSGIQSGGAGPLPAATPGSDPCYGDEQITYSPELPRVGNELLIAVTSARPHPYGRLAGTERTQFVRERPGQRGYVWEWTVQPSYPGNHEYTFYVDSTIPCQKVQISVRNALATKTPTPTKTATPWNWNENNNGNNNNNNNNNNNDNNNNGSRAPSINPSSYVVAGQDWYNCNAFLSQSQAQSVLRYDPTDPNQLDREDGSRDGVACRTYNYSSYPNDRDETPVQIVGGSPPTSTPTLASAPPPTATTGVFDPRNYIGQGDRYNCVDFASQADTQAVLRADVTDPNKLDISSPQSETTPDGIACNTRWDAPEWASWFYFPEPHDMTPVSRTPTPTGGSAGTPVPGTPTPYLATPILGSTPVNDSRPR